MALTPVRTSNQLRVAIVLQTPRDPLSAVYIASDALAGELRSAGHDAAIYTPADFSMTRALDGRWMPLVYPAAVAAWLRREASRLDLVVFHSYAGWLAMSLPIGRLPPAVIAFHGLEPLYHRQLRAEMAARGQQLSWRYRALQEKFMPLMLRTACRRAAAVLCLNTHEREFLIRRHWAAPPAIHVMPHGIEPEFFAPPRQPAPVRRLLFVGQWLPMKGIHDLVEASTRLMQAHPEVTLVCAGTGRSAEEILPAFPDAVRGRVTVLAKVNHPTLQGLYRETDAFVFPSLSEGFSRAIIEAMAAGLPIVATEVAVDVLRPEVNALTVPRRSASAIVKAVERLIADPLLAHRLGSAAAATASSYRADERVADKVRLLTRIASQRRTVS